MSDDAERRRLRVRVLGAFGARGEDVDRLLEYNENVFEPRCDLASLALPMDDEPFVEAWRGYVERSRVEGAHRVLSGVLRQLRFPIREGMSAQPGYRGVVLRGEPADECALATGLPLRRPQAIRVFLQPTPGGTIPVVVLPERRDFEDVVRAVTMRNEPEPIPASMGAAIVTGYNNWDRVEAYRRQWIQGQGDRASDEGWAIAFRRLRMRRSLYQDRLILLSEGPYSGVPAAELGLSEPTWRALSFQIRLHHECCHYFTKSVLGSMRNNLLDELLADYLGIVAALGHFRASWFLRFMGLEDEHTWCPGGRIGNYRGDPPLPDSAFGVLQQLVRAAALALERFDRDLPPGPRDPAATGRLVAALATLTLEEMASDEASRRLASALARVGHPSRGPAPP